MAAAQDSADATMARHLPAPKTFAPSRDDVLSTLGFFFGDPATPEKLKDYSEHHAMTYHFPDAYYGQNTKIRETLNNLILRSPQDWQTNVALPFVRITGTTVEWDEMRFDVRLLQRVPYEGISRMQTSLRRRHRDRVVRRGIGMMIESDFYATEAGRAHFSDQLTSIRYCVQETCNFDCIFSYLTCGNYDFRYDIQKGLRPRRAVRQAMAHEVNFYAIVQKEGLGFDKCVEDAKARMARYQIVPNMLVVPPQLLLYMSLAPEEKIKYSEGGPAAAAAFEAGVAGYEARSFRGMGVFQSVPFEVSDDQDSVQMLQRSTQIGEFYRMSPPAVWHSKKHLPGAYMDVILYDEEKDQHVHIPFSEAFYAAGLGDISDPAAGATTPAYDLFGTLNTNILTDDVIAKFKSQPDFGGAGNPPNVAIALPAVAGDPVRPAFAGAPTVNALKALSVAEVRVGLQYLLFYRLFDSADNLATARSIVECVNAGVWLPIEIVIARPFIEHMAMSAIMTVSGRDTGATLFGPADMQISANTSVKTIEGHYTCHTKSVITKPQNVMVLRDIMLSGYVAGNNTRWFGATSTYGVSGPLPAQDIQNDITERLSFANDSSGEYASMLAFAAHYGDGAKRDQVVSLSHRLLPWEVTRPTSEYKSYFPGGPTAFEVYSNRYQLGQIHFGEDIRAAENMEFISQGSVNNALCFVGPHRKYSAFTSNYYELQPGQGHFGPDAIPGDARWRRGESVSLAAARNSMVSLEVAAQSQLVMTRRDRGP